jgi:microcin C transport system ATP-binding protein
MLEIQDFSVVFQGPRKIDDFKAVNNVSLSIKSGERFALVGESGSGKTVTALSILNLLPDSKTSGCIYWKEKNLLSLREEEIRLVRGNEIAMIFQEPMSALNPLLSVGEQIGEVLDIHFQMPKNEKLSKVLDLLEQTGIDDPYRRINCFPHELSGGQRQRVLISMALACEPSFLIADEPTTALDMTVRQQILNLLFSIQEKKGMSILLITHDLPLVERFADRVGVMKNGEIIELESKEDIFTSPQHYYTKKLLASRPKPLNAKFIKRKVLVEVRNLSCNYNIGKGFFSRKKFSAVLNENFAIYKGETLGVVGESGSGKTSLGLAIMKLFPGNYSGQIKFDGIDLFKTKSKKLLHLRKKLQMVFQDPFSSLSPRLTIGQILEEGLILHFPNITSDERIKLCLDVLDEVGLKPEFLSRYPHEFS